MLIATTTQAEFYKEFLMKRGSFEPADYGINLPREEFLDQMTDDFNSTYHGQWSFDELLLHPREALRFCDSIRIKHHYFDLPDDIILRAIMIRRKNP